MAGTDHKIVIPVSQQECLEIIFTHSLSAWGNNGEMPVPRLYRLSDAGNTVFIEVSPEHRDYKEMFRLLKTASRIISSHIKTGPDFMIATVTGFQFIRSVQILYFKYSKEKKQWVVILTDNTCLQLKRNITANDILTYSSSFVRINTQHIVNLDHLIKIEGRKCILSIHTGDTELIISRNYLRELRGEITVL